jgi:hypothetical protein
MPYSHKVSLEEMWRVIGDSGIKREAVEIIYPTEEQVSKLYGIIKKRNHEQSNQETIRQLLNYVEKLKNDNKS